jgi:hypothetical protein
MLQPPNTRYLGQIRLCVSAKNHNTKGVYILQPYFRFEVSIFTI